MLNNLRQIHPHARLWIITTIILGLVIVLKTPAREFIVPPHGKVVAYYQNDYQRYALDSLIAQDNLEQYPCLYELWIRESNWRPKALNKSSKALGIAQLMPKTWVNIKVKPTLDGYKQVDAGLRYLKHRYGTKGICKAYAHHLAKGWY
jgi:soluble lytic murein transglycosylase-like protein